MRGLRFKYMGMRVKVKLSLNKSIVLAVDHFNMFIGDVHFNVRAVMVDCIAVTRDSDWVLEEGTRHWEGQSEGEVLAVCVEDSRGLEVYSGLQ